MKKNVAEVLMYIHTNGLDNTEWNIETTEVPYNYYGESGNDWELPAHIALYHNSHDYTEKEASLYCKCDLALYTKELGFIYLYYL